MALETELDTYSYTESKEPGLTFRVVRKLFEQCWESNFICKVVWNCVPNIWSLRKFILQYTKCIVFSPTCTSTDCFGGYLKMSSLTLGPKSKKVSSVWYCSGAGKCYKSGSWLVGFLLVFLKMVEHVGSTCSSPEGQVNILNFFQTKAD